MTEVTLLARAQKLAARGIPVLPAEPGTKRPRPLKWQTTATTDPDQINEWWQRWPDSWVGVPMGLRTGLLVVDLDDKNGKTGSANFATLVGERELPECPIRQTPSGGVHLYFRHVPGARNSVSLLADGVDVRAEGGQVISYSDDFPSEAPECPNWLKELILARSSGLSLMPAAEDPYDGRRRALTREELSRAAGARDTPAKRLCGQIYDGVAWGVAGGRSNALTTLRTYLLSTYPDLDPEGTAELFAESCAAVRAADEGVPRADETTVQWAAQMLRGGIGYATALRAHEDKLRAEAQRAFPGLVGPLGPPRDLVVQSDTAYFLRGADGDLDGPWAERNVVTRARDLFADRTDVALRRGKSGDGEWKSGVQLARDYGTAVNSVVYDYGLKRSEVRGTTLAMRCAPLRDLEPREDAQIAEWLRLLGGPQHDQLLDWLATVLETTRATAGIYVCGPTGLGKSMLPLGLTRLWSLAEGPCPFPQALDKFNLDVIRCPVVFADEDLKLPRHSHETPANALKRVIDQTKRRVEEKYVGRAELIGAYRVVITTNKTPVEIFQESLTSMDIGALDQRVLVLEPAPGCREYLEALGGHDTTDAWVEGCGIARHVLWLAQERGPRVVRGGRYLVPGAGFGALLAAGNEGSRAICQAVLVAIEKQLADVVQVSPAPHTGVWVCPSELRERWRSLLRDAAPPDDWRDAVDSACTPDVAQLRSSDHVRRRYRRVRPEVLAHVKQLQE